MDLNFDCTFSIFFYSIANFKALYFLPDFITYILQKPEKLRVLLCIWQLCNIIGSDELCSRACINCKRVRCKENIKSVLYRVSSCYYVYKSGGTHGQFQVRVMIWVYLMCSARNHYYQQVKLDKKCLDSKVSGNQDSTLLSKSGIQRKVFVTEIQTSLPTEIQRSIQTQISEFK